MYVLACLSVMYKTRQKTSFSYPVSSSVVIIKWNGWKHESSYHYLDMSKQEKSGECDRDQLPGATIHLNSHTHMWEQMPECKVGLRHGTHLVKEQALVPCSFMFMRNSDRKGYTFFFLILMKWRVCTFQLITVLFDVYFGMHSCARLDRIVGRIWPVGRELIITALVRTTISQKF